MQQKQEASIKCAHFIFMNLSLIANFIQNVSICWHTQFTQTLQIYYEVNNSQYTIYTMLSGL